MAAPTLTPQDNDQDERLNPGEKNAEDLFEKHGVLSQDEVDARRNQYGVDSQKQAAESEKKSINDSVAGKAATGAAATTASTVATPVAGQLVKWAGKIKTKKGGVGALVVGVILFLVIVSLGFLGPGLLLIQVKEALTEKFNDVTTAISERQTLIVQKKIGNATSGCSVKVKCRFKGMSDRQIAKFEKNNWVVEKEGSKVLNKTRILSLTTPDGTKITAGNYKQILRSDPVALGHANRVYNPKFTSYSSRAFQGLSARLGISKEQKIKGTTQAELDESMNKSIDGLDDQGREIGRPREENGKYYDADGREISKAQYDTTVAQLAEFDSKVNDIKSTGKRAVLSAAKSGALVSLTGGLAVVDSLCTGYYLIQMVGYGAKVIQQRELIRYAFTIVNTSDLNKASDATANIVSYMGTKMTTPNAYGEHFTDSFGYKYVAHGSLALPTENNEDATNLRRASISQFANGGGLGGTLLNFNSQLNAATGNSPQEVCGIVKNPFAQIGLLIGGVALTIGTGGTNLAPGLVTTATISGVIAVVIGVAVPILQNMAAGESANNDTVGGDAGNATVSGMGALNAQNSQSHGLSPLTKDNVAGYIQHGKEIAALHKAADNTQTGAFDVYNPSSASFAIASTLSTQLSTIKKGVVSSPAAIITNSVSGLFRSKVSAADPLSEYQICTDTEYNAKNYAADPFCNIRYGMSPTELIFDPETVVNFMYDNDYIDEEGRPLDGEFQDYIADCIQRIDPLGSSGTEGQGDDGSKCNDQTEKYQYFRTYYLDTIVNDDMDDEDTFSLGQTATNPSAGAPSAIGTPEDVVIKGDGFTLADGKDYSGIACADGTKTLDTYTHPTANFKIQLCEVNGIDVASIISANTKQMLDAAAAEGITLTGGGFRSYEEQLALRITNGCPDPINSPSSACSPPTAKPGSSMHERGLALDLQWNGETICFPRSSSNCTGNRAFNWLTNNASRFNFYNLPREAWHWSTSGT